MSSSARNQSAEMAGIGVNVALGPKNRDAKQFCDDTASLNG